MSSLKQVIYNALYKISTPVEGVEQVDYETPEAARDDFIAKVMAELFPEDSSTVTVPTAEKSSPKKSSKKSPEDKAAAKAEKEAAKAAKAAEKEAAKAAKEAEKEAAKAAKSPKKSPEDKAAAKAAEKAEKEAAKAAEKAEKEAAKAAEKAEKEAAKAAEKAEKAAAKAAEKAEKKSPKKNAEETPLPASPAAAEEEKKAPVKQRVKPGPKPKVVEDVNIQKIDPTWRKHLKAAAKTAGKEYSKDMEAELLAWLNRMDKAAFDGAKAEDHARAFLTPMTGSNAAAVPRPATPEPADVDAIEVEFKGKTYYVDPVSKRVYEQDGEVSRGVGYVGMAAFADMELPDDA